MTKEYIDKKRIKTCNLCGETLNSWDLRCSKALGYKNPICEICIAKEYGKTKEELREIMEEFFGLRPCLGI